MNGPDLSAAARGELLDLTAASLEDAADKAAASVGRRSGFFARQVRIS